MGDQRRLGGGGDCDAYPTPTAEMKVPRNAKVRIEPKLRKKLSCISVSWERRTVRHMRTCLSSYPEFRMIGGSSRLKNSVCLNVCQFARQHDRASCVFKAQKAGHPMLRVLTNISRIIVPGANLTIRPTAMPAKIDTSVSCTARMRLICK